MTGDALKYRRDVDGLRAVAVLAVIAFHMDAPLFAGGFVGVDVFFVISGYLITKIIGTEIDQRTFTLVGFYERRIRRILPALFAMLGIVWVVAVATLIPFNFEPFAISAAAAAFSISNIFFFIHAGYFEISADYQILLHTWSLGVEEQFYVFFPLIFLFLRRTLRVPWVITIWSLLVVSLVIAVVQTAMQPQGAFYLPMSRAHEFLLGSALAMNAVPAPPRSPFLRNAMAVLGLGLIAFSIITFTRNVPFPGSAALIPTVGTCLVLYANSNGSTAVGRMLSLSPFVGVGLISYSLYLWHWPLLAFARLYGATGAPWTSVALFGVMLFLGWLSWRFVELPVRENKRFFTRRLVYAAAAVGAVGFLGAGGVVGKLDGLPQRLSAESLAIASGAYDVDNRRFSCQREAHQIRRGELCRIGSTNGVYAFALFGDSFAGALIPAVEEAAHRENLQGEIFTQGGCAPLQGVISETCSSFVEASLDRLEAMPSIQTVLLVARWDAVANGSRFGAVEVNGLFLRDAESRQDGLEETRAVFYRALRRTVGRLEGKRIIIIGYVPEQTSFVPAAGALRLTYLRDSTFGVARPIVARRQRPTRALLSRISSELGVPVLDLTPELCNADLCPAVVSGRAVYADDNHLSRFGAEQLAPLVATVLTPDQD